MKNTLRTGTLLAILGICTLAHGQGLQVTRGLAVALEATDSMVQDTAAAAVAAGETVAIWTDGTSLFSLANNTNPADGPVYRNVGDAGFNASLFNGKGYLEFEAPASGAHADPGDALYSSDPILMPARKGAMAGSVFIVLAPAFTIHSGDITGTRTNDPNSGTSNGFFIEPRLVSESTEIERFWLGNAGGAGGYEGTVTAFSGGSMANDGSTAYILEWRSLSSTDVDGHRAFYINGERVGEDTESVVVPSSVTKLGIGGSPDNLNAFNGAMAAFMVFDEELNEAERNAVGVYLQDEYGISGAYTAPSMPSTASILIDFGKAALTSGGALPAWNDVVPPADGSSITGSDMADTIFPYTLVEDLVDDNGDSTGISLVYSEWIPGADPSQNGNGIAGMEVAGEMPATGYPESATVDSLYVNAGATVVLSLEGLDPKMAYDLKFFGTSSATDTRISVWMVNGLSQSILTDGNSSGFVTFPQVMSTAEGVIEVTYYAAATGRNQGHWSTMEIKQAPQPGFDLFDAPAVAGPRISPWFGAYIGDYAPLYLTESNLWLHAGGSDTTSLYLYSHNDASWWWTARDVWPALYRTSDGSWHSLWQGNGEAWLYGYESGQWIPLITAQ
jgi:hypothetical protein